MLNRLTLPPAFDRFLAHLRTPLYRNGYALVFSSAATSALGLVYWMLAARLYEPAVVGLNSAILSAMIFLANVSQLNLMNALNRFLPNAGRAGGRLIGGSYLVSLGVAVVVSMVFLSGLGVWSPTLRVLQSDLGYAAWFILATGLWCWFVLQDAALTGLRQAHWVPLENLFFAAAKIVLLWLLAGVAPQVGLFASWTVAVAVTLLPTNWFIFRHLLPERARVVASAEPIALKTLARFVAGDYLSSLVALAASNLLPLLVVERAGASANAYFYLAWTMAYTLYLVSRNMGQSFIAEAVAEAGRLNDYLTRTFVQTARMLVPLVAAVVLGAPFILQLFGPDYVREGTWLLQLLCLSALPNMVTTLYTSLARVQRRTGALLLVQTVLAVLVFGLSYLWLDAFGIAGVGAAWLVGQTVIAAVLLATELRLLWISRLNLRRLFERIAGLRQWWWRRVHARHIAQAQASLPQVLARLASPGARQWVVQSVVPTLSDLTVLMLGREGQPASAVLKIPQSPTGAETLRRQREVLAELHAEERLGTWRAVLPVITAHGEVAGHPYYVEQRLPGISLESLLADRTAGRGGLAAAAACLGEFHRRTALSVKATEAMLARWVDEPLVELNAVNAARYNHRYNQSIERLRSELRASLSGRILTVCWTHGDFTPGNILLKPDGSTVTGIVDWALAAPGDLPQGDILMLLLAARMRSESRELGDVVRDLARTDAWAPHEVSILSASRAGLPGATLEPGALLRLCWLRHIAANLGKAARYAKSPWWVLKNVEAVLQTL